VVECPIIDHVVIDQKELGELSEMIKEATYEKNR
jgi:hypothetical protein